MTIDLEELKRKAEAATPGEWTVNGGDDVVMSDGHLFWAGSDENAEFIAAANPSVILELIRMIQEKE